MIEILSGDLCVDCDICVKVCPTNVFDAVAGGTPVIARQQDCQTCFMCEAYCPTGALFVATSTEPAPEGAWQRDEAQVGARGMLGKYRDDLGWNRGQTPRAAFATPLLAQKHISAAASAARSKNNEIGQVLP
ncbi:ferredoxin family protein [Pseudonocardia ailaonensis]|uniref:Ferredoxin family protein n=1 Tax=Pseudonocardia ailaonensis TaxID=367279 RepID=A0ABN2MLW5_9PSEU